MGVSGDVRGHIDRANSAPDIADASNTAVTRSRWATKFIPTMGNFCVQYNITSASIAAQILGDKTYLGYPLAEEPKWSKDLTRAAVFAGAMAGMMFMGRLGDVIGRTRAMKVTLILTMLGAIIPACSFGSPDQVYAIVCAGRFILGIGVGGIYPLSATHAAECCEDHSDRGTDVGMAFVWQSWGALAPYVVAMMLLGPMDQIAPAEWVPQLQYRFLFAFGAIPALAVLIATMGTEDSAEFRAQQRSQCSNGGMMSICWTETWATLKPLIGTAGAWFIYDIAYYGTSIFVPEILDSICLAGSKSQSGSCTQTIFQTALQSAIVSIFSPPGCYLAVMFIKKTGSKNLNVFGFLLLAVNFVVLALFWDQRKSEPIVLFGIFCALTFLLNYGPSVGTFVLPTICFPTRVRSTCHGLSATGGKIGAVAGTLLFPIISDTSLGTKGVLSIQAAFCVLGAAIACLFLEHDWQYLERERAGETQETWTLRSSGMSGA